ncbi:hypothetical protein ACN20G_33570 (plasmid) [Streptomyces sp. BI20]|uniref:hypothetical protein n=1 Tax=Streptomyces sp. BI20 TaxID=3403460 RepID=UPI003C78D0D8
MTATGICLAAGTPGTDTGIVPGVSAPTALPSTLIPTPSSGLGAALFQGWGSTQAADHPT